MEKVLSSRYCFEAGDRQTTQVDGNLTCDNKTSIVFDIHALLIIKSCTDRETEQKYRSNKKTPDLSGVRILLFCQPVFS